MKMQQLSSLILLSALAFSGAVSAADDVPTGKKVSEILQNIQKDGYVIVKDIEYKGKDKQFEAKVLKNDGSKLTLEISSETGQIIKPRDEVPVMSIFQAAQHVEDAGYTITKIEAGDKKFEIDAFKNNKKVSLKVDIQKGTIEE